MLNGAVISIFKYILNVYIFVLSELLSDLVVKINHALMTSLYIYSLLWRILTRDKCMIIVF